jgi:hypothetical protein
MSNEFGPDKKAIMEYLKLWPTTFISGREIARKVGGKKRYAEDRSWAVPVLMHLVEQGLIETDSMGGYRLFLKEENSSKRSKSKRYISPQILKILKNSGKEFEGVVIDIDVDDESSISPCPEPWNSSNRKKS